MGISGRKKWTKRYQGREFASENEQKQVLEAYSVTYHYNYEPPKVNPSESEKSFQLKGFAAGKTGKLKGRGRYRTSLTGEGLA